MIGRQRCGLVPKFAAQASAEGQPAGLSQVRRTTITWSGKLEKISRVKTASESDTARSRPRGRCRAHDDNPLHSRCLQTRSPNRRAAGRIDCKALHFLAELIGLLISPGEDGRRTSGKTSLALGLFQSFGAPDQSVSSLSWSRSV